MRQFHLLTFTLAFTCLMAQDQLGISTSNYAGTDAVATAPGRAVYQWQFADINLIGVGANVWNNYVSLGGRQRSAFGELAGSINGTGSDLVVNRSFSDRLKKGSLFAQINGPAFMAGFGKNAFGIHVTSKAQLSVSGISNETANWAWEGLHYDAQQGQELQQKNLRIAANAYTEFGGTFSRQLMAEGNSLLSAGATVKYLMGHSAAGLLMSNIDYNIHNDSSLTVNELNGEYGFVEPAIRAGKGMGIDLGFHYQRTMQDVSSYVPHSTPMGCEPQEYKYRFSVSLLDVGAIRYKNATTGAFDAAVGNIANYNALNASEAEQIDSLFQSNLNGVDSSSEFKMGLATALSMQVDVRVMDKLFVGLVGMQPIGGRSHLRIRRNAYLAAIPRIETERFEFSLPITFMEYQGPVVGAAVRLNSVVIGSDNVFPWMSKQSSIHGADIYAKLKITLFRKSSCQDRVPKAKSDVAMDGESSMPCVLPD